MVRLAAALVLLCAGCASAATSTGEVSTDEHAPPTLYGLDLPTVERLTITGNGMGSPAEPDVQPTCTDFVLDEAQVRKFLRDADGVDQRDYMHTLDWSASTSTAKMLASGPNPPPDHPRLPRIAA